MLAACIGFGSCNNKGLFQGKSTPHQQYKEGLIKTGLQQTHMGKQWIAMADKSLLNPVKINLPYKENGYFAPDKPSALGYSFTLRRGDKLIVSFTLNPARGFKLFSDLWLPDKRSSNDDPLAIMDTLSNTLQYIVKKEGEYIVRVQPELLYGIEYTMSITTTASLAFPVQQSGKPRIISLWGVGRDNNSRKHEGIDISAPFRTPALAVANGYITRVDVNNLGGKVVFLHPQGTDYSVYYAHLDEQSVKSGQSVKEGDIVGLVGNTGNAKFTAPHLHFGIYASGGAIDPLAFVDKDRPEPKGVSGSKQYFNTWVQTKGTSTVYLLPLAKSIALTTLKKGDILYVRSAMANWYKINLPDGREGYINYDMLSDGILRKQKLLAATKLLDQPVATAPAITTIAAGDEIEVKGIFNEFIKVKYKDKEGWIK